MKSTGKNPETRLSTTWEDDHWCFACGSENPCGLHLAFEPWGEHGLQSRYMADKRYQGYKDVVHGGFLGLLLDEVIANCLWKREGIWVITAEIQLRLLRPAPVNRSLLIRALPEDKARGRLVHIHGEILLEDGTRVATARAKCLKVPAPPTTTE